MLARARLAPDFSGPPPCLTHVKSDAIRAALDCGPVLQIEGDDGVHFRHRRSAAFAACPVRQHQLVYATLGDRWANEIHASSSTPTPRPGFWAEFQKEPADRPDCRWINFDCRRLPVRRDRHFRVRTPPCDPLRARSPPEPVTFTNVPRLNDIGTLPSRSGRWASEPPMATRHLDGPPAWRTTRSPPTRWSRPCAPRSSCSPAGGALRGEAAELHGGDATAPVRWIERDPRACRPWAPT